MAEIRDWQIERFVLGELPPAEQQAVARAIAEDPALRARVDAIEASSRAILAAHPPRVAASIIRERLAAPPRPAAAWGRRVAFAAAASLAVVGAGLGVLRLREGSSTPRPRRASRAFGRTSVSSVRRRPGSKRSPKGRSPARETSCSSRTRPPAALSA